jgi:hypothetical protein
MFVSDKDKNIATDGIQTAYCSAPSNFTACDLTYVEQLCKSCYEILCLLVFNTKYCVEINRRFGFHLPCREIGQVRSQSGPGSKLGLPHAEARFSRYGTASRGGREN